MAFRHGKFASILVNAIDLTAFSDNMDLSVDADMADTSMFASTWKSNIAGLLGAKLEISGAYDGTVTTGPSSALLACMAAGAAVACVAKPGGTAAGQRTNSFNAFVTNFSEHSGIGAAVTWKASLLVTGAVTPTTQ